MLSDPYTQEFQLCDPDGIVRRGAMWHGTDYTCTTHAHFGGEHIRCTNPFHLGTLLCPTCETRLTPLPQPNAENIHCVCQLGHRWRLTDPDLRFWTPEGRVSRDS